MEPLASRTEIIYDMLCNQSRDLLVHRHTGSSGLIFFVANILNHLAHDVSELRKDVIAYSDEAVQQRYYKVLKPNGGREPR